MATQAQNLSREMILPAYKAAISPGPPIPPGSPMPHLFVLSPSGLILSHTKQILMLTRKSTYKIGAVSCKTNPISQIPQIDLSPVSAMGYEKTGPSAALKAKPKQTQTKPIRPPFFAQKRHPKPKQTQTKPIELEAQRRSLRVSLSRSESRGPNKPNLSARSVRCSGMNHVEYTS
jgi:hypothetical protein